MDATNVSTTAEPAAQDASILATMSKTQLFFSLILALVIVPRLLKIISRLISPISRIPGPFINKISSIPLMKASAAGKTHELSARLHAKYGPIVVLSPRMISVSDKNEVKRIIHTEDWPKSELIYGNFRQNPARPTLIAFTDKKAYAERKRLISGWFGMRYIRSLQPLMQQCIDETIKVVEAACDDPGSAGEVDMQNLCTATAVDIIGTTIFGQSFDVVKNGSHPLPTFLRKMLKASGLLLFMPWIRSIPFRPTRPAYIDRFTLDIMESRRRTAKTAPRQDLLQKLVERLDDEDGKLTPFDVQGEVTIMLVAGTETTANSELFTLLMLARHPDKLRRVYEEVDAWYTPGDFSRAVDCEYSLHGMTYLQACEDEAMRLVPAQATGSPRESRRDESVLGYRVPAGTTVFPTTQGVHHDESVWPDAKEYIPERWLEIYENGKVNEQYFWPFSAGSRVCIGKHFALQEMHLMLVSLLRRFEFEYVPGQLESTVFRVAQHMEAPKYVLKVRRRKF
ncbi:Cytochrome P450 monooxygenase FUS8 [Lasiodiplodia hormozganensis]|uniref:Cytochrome P450 monooxygenase FUS8 n=1 Tax=Lasiodiplodia hormozganensis TaxID=869390 RepID=A0AA40CNU1_9PEZI|nr:Cytochrome P450 monooxygenase FUS8 [Lasiodiplodia hormozganensis]